MLSRPIKLFVGVTFLLLSCVPVAVLLFMEGSKRQEALPAMGILFAVFGAPGLWALVSGLKPALLEHERRFVEMRFLPSRVLIGFGACAAGFASLYLFYEVIHVSTRLVLFASMAAVVFGPIYAAMSWAESCRQCRTPLESAGQGAMAVQFCSECSSFLISKGRPDRPVFTGREASERIARLASIQAPPARG